MNKTKQIKALRDGLKWALPLAEEIFGAYPPHVIKALKKAAKTCRRILKETKPRRK